MWNGYVFTTLQSVISKYKLLCIIIIGCLRKTGKMKAMCLQLVTSYEACGKTVRWEQYFTLSACKMLSPWKHIPVMRHDGGSSMLWVFFFFSVNVLCLALNSLMKLELCFKEKVSVSVCAKLQRNTHRHLLMQINAKLCNGVWHKLPIKCIDVCGYVTQYENKKIFKSQCILSYQLLQVDQTSC